ncbi:MAG TPA: hypothetical protein DD643_01470, partial [Synechococcus sp. UBA8638]|nr:hypothetical protein [Synechococcus sp. UBA8638]
MMPILKRQPLRLHGSRDSAGFTLVEVVVSSSILAFALAGSFRGWSQGQALVQQANQRQVLLDAVEQDLQRQQGFVIQQLKTKAPWACEMPLAELREKLKALPHDLPETVERQWFMDDASPVLAIRYSSPKLQAPRERLLAFERRGSICDEAVCDDKAKAMVTGSGSGDQDPAGGGIQPGGTADHCCSAEPAGGPC